MNLIDLAKEVGLCPIRCGESYCSPCPGCGGKDRFIIWPNNRYWCRRCEKHGDSIQFCRAFLGISYFDACKKLHLETKYEFTKTYQKDYQSFKIATMPPSLWREKATAFAEWSHQFLLKHPNQISKLFERGINYDTIISYKLGLCLDPKKEIPTGFLRERTDWGLPEKLKDDLTTKKLWLPYGLVIPYFGSDGLVLKRVLFERVRDALLDFALF